MTSPSAFFDLAHEALTSARLTLDAGLVRNAVNRCYYAMFYAASAAVTPEGVAPKSHKGLKTAFHDLYIKTGRIDADTGRLLGHAERHRLRADYDAFSILDANAARDLLTDAERFVAAVEAMLASGDG